MKYFQNNKEISSNKPKLEGDKKTFLSIEFLIKLSLLLNDINERTISFIYKKIEKKNSNIMNTFQIQAKLFI